MESKIQLEHLLDETGNSTEQLKGIEYQTQIDIYEPGTHVMYNSFDGPPKSPFVGGGKQTQSNPIGGTQLPSGNQLHYYGPNPDALEEGGFTDPNKGEKELGRHEGRKLNSYETAMADYFSEQLGFLRGTKNNNEEQNE